MTVQAIPTGTAREAALDEYAGMMRALHFGERPGGRRAPPFADVDLTMPQLRLVWLLATRPAGMHGRELAGVLGVGPSAVTALVERIVEHGYARRDEDQQDRRITWVSLTDRGRALAERLAAGQRERLGEMLDLLSPDQLNLVLEAFRVLRAAGEVRSPGSSAASS